MKSAELTNETSTNDRVAKCGIARSAAIAALFSLVSLSATLVGCATGHSERQQAHGTAQAATTVGTAAWPSAEFGAMGLEGSVRLGFRKELEAAAPAEREALFNQLLQQAIARGEALNMASHLEIDDVIDPADTRAWLARVLAAAPPVGGVPRRAFVDAW